MGILKFDRKLLDEDNLPTRVARLHLSTQFDEDLEKSPTAFKSGGAVFEDGTGKHQDTPDVFGKISDTLAELTPPPTKI